ncbi:unnamed protein product [Symbiodinium necroappetens]|uniref:EF-hand domain-containing protein n=1 Tax=Symbiodinium necroappetens TaxID=1628268 RepID=A0A812QRC1_9DINO|nr:unnamed protein product [Symbiodinium necroappetens]
MRGVGQGQCIEILLIPEVASLANKVLAKAEGVDSSQRISRIRMANWEQQILVDIIGWLIVNGLVKDLKKSRLLCQQNARNLWRQYATAHLESAPSDVHRWLKDSKTKTCLDCLRNRIDFTVSNAVPGSPPQPLKDKLVQEFDAIRRDGHVWSESVVHEVQATFQGILASLSPEMENESMEGGLELDGEQVPDKEYSPLLLQGFSIAEKMKWLLRALTKDLAASGLPFFPLTDFAVNKGLLGGHAEPLKGLPEFIWLSDNYYRRSWRLSSVRRIKNVICFLEWVPDAASLATLAVTSKMTERQRERLEEVYRLYDQDGDGKIKGHELRAFFQALDLDEEGEEIQKRHHGSLSLKEIQEELTRETFYRMQKGRYFVVLSLEEAEHLRGSMHLLGSDWPKTCGIALRCLGNLESKLDSSLLDELGPVTERAGLA